MADGRSTQIPDTQSRFSVARPLRPRVKLPVHSFEPLLIDMSVNLRRRNIGMTQHFLNNPQIRTVSEQVRREAMPQKVRIHVLFQSAAPRVLLNDLPNTRCR